jgi:protein AATF/BFR2
VDQIMANPARLVARTRVRRAEYRVLGGGADREQQDRQIFDDSDFYHTLLRELIERKTTGSGEAGQAGRQWLQVQKMRSKLRKKVDTRASKGRKIRYDVHAKLVNFMAPVSAPNQMQDTAKNELFSSLFGVRKLPTTAA